ncbi:MAG: APH(3') family aminoglycoside O-phosphotransferase [Armatimonadota bacterium]
MTENAEIELPGWLLDEWRPGGQPYLVQTLTTGYSGAEVLRLNYHDHSPLVLKMRKLGPGITLKEEADRLEWACKRLPTAEVFSYCADDVHEFLLMTNIRGVSLEQHANAPEVDAIAHVLADGLRQIHGLSVADCPFDETLDIKLKRAEEGVLANLVSPEQFAEEHKGWSSQDILQQLIDTRPADEDLVVTHGDYCLPNILMDNGRLAGFVDLGLFGIADRYQDLALASRSLEWNNNAEQIPLLFKAYGLETVDEEKLKYYQMLDELY